MKRYYLIQFAFWLQQIVVVNIEERRKDYHQMLTHHIITCFLVLTSYGHHFTKVGHVILCLMEVVDVILPVSTLHASTGASGPCWRRSPANDVETFTCSWQRCSSTCTSKSPAMSPLASSWGPGSWPGTSST